MARPVEQEADPGHTFMQLWAESLSLVLGQIAGTPFPMMPAEGAPEKSPATESDVLLAAMIAGPAPGELSFRVPLASALVLAKLFMQEEGTPAELTADGRSALEELFRQVAGYVATSGRVTLPGIAVTIAAAETPTWTPAASGWIDSATGAPQSVAIEWKMSAALNAALAAPRADAVAETAGAQYVLELDREVQDPADLLLDGKLVARGEVVMVDGNYGLRVSEVFTATRPII
jgi:flagellar motor switch protein FliN/FliY